MNLAVAERIVGMSSQPSSSCGLLAKIWAGNIEEWSGDMVLGVGVKAGFVKKYLYRRSLQENRAEKFSGVLGHQARTRISEGSSRLRICA